VLDRANFEVGAILPSLRSERLLLRWLTGDDVPALFAIFSDDEVTRYWGRSTLPDLTAAEELLGEIERGFRTRTLFEWGVEIVATGELAGTCTLSALSATHRRAELGFALGRAHWKLGYMSEVLPVLLRFAFAKLGLHRLMADADPRNRASLQLLERLGFQREGYLREHYLVNDELQDAVVYGLLRKESPFSV
jgi:RimJ/RimL family protein N-acetyltransferase